MPALRNLLPELAAASDAEAKASRAGGTVSVLVFQRDS